jgi:hypothetical protein
MLGDSQKSLQSLSALSSPMKSLNSPPSRPGNVGFSSGHLHHLRKSNANLWQICKWDTPTIGSGWAWWWEWVITDMALTYSAIGQISRVRSIPVNFLTILSARNGGSNDLVEAWSRKYGWKFWFSGRWIKQFRFRVPARNLYLLWVEVVLWRLSLFNSS